MISDVSAARKRVLTRQLVRRTRMSPSGAIGDLFQQLCRSDLVKRERRANLAARLTKSAAVHRTGGELTRCVRTCSIQGHTANVLEG